MNEALVTVVVAYVDLATALRDFDDLAQVRRDHQVGHYDAAVVHTRSEGRTDVTVTTVSSREKATLHGAGLGLVVGVLFAPALSAALLGASLGAVVGHVAARVEAFKHANLPEVNRIVGEGAAHLLIIATPAVADDIARAAVSRERHTRLLLDDADVTLLKEELQGLGYEAAAYPSASIDDVRGTDT
jgi:uncharacterized membrane protein